MSDIRPSTRANVAQSQRQQPGLHFTPHILSEMKARGIETAEITLHVGLGTFQPVRVEKVEEHKLHSERYNISAEVAAQNKYRAWSRSAGLLRWARQPCGPSNLRRGTSVGVQGGSGELTCSYIPDSIFGS